MSYELKKGSKLRLFVAIELPEEAQNALASLKEKMGNKLQGIRWIKPRNLHLTLQFLGYCPEEMVKDISKQLHLAVTKYNPFEFHLENLGGFPSLKRPRIFWIGVGGGAEKICEVQKEVENSLAALDFQPEERKFHPHITIARFKKSEDLREAVAKIETRSIFPQPIKAEGVVLFLSQLTPVGANYHPLEKIYFKRS